MKALLVCPRCGYRMIGAGPDAEGALAAAVAGLQLHEDKQHGVVMTPERFVTGVRVEKARES